MALQVGDGNSNTVSIFTPISVEMIQVDEIFRMGGSTTN